VPPAESAPGSPAASSAPAARCKHFGWCGGCARQDVPYEAQLAAKEAELRQVLGDHAAALEPIVSGSPWYYRNKMEFAFGFGRDGVAIGLRRRGKFFGVVDVEECYLMTEAAPTILAAARAWATERGLPPYHLRRHDGLLRYVVLREGKRTGRLLAMLVTAPPPDEAAFAPALEDLAGRLRPLGVTSLLWVVNDRRADLAAGEIRRIVFGEPTFEEVLGGRRFDLSPFAFFQPNVALAERLGERARVLLGDGWPVLLDLYCGVGGLTLALAGCAQQVIGVESEAAAVADATRSAAANGLSNCRFVAEDVLTFLRRFSNWSFLADRWAVVLDPPRAGTHPKVPLQLLRVGPPVIVYVSCNPKKFAEDLSVLGRDYRLETAVPYDFFPHTPHMEVLAKLVRR
jgi:23S rRNA (uracil1939-C5)-methyltransferase